MTTPPPAPKHTLYDIANYSIGMKQQKLTKETSSSVRVRRTEDVYHREGLRRTVDAVLLVHSHNHPHLLLLQVNQNFYKLPGGKQRPGEDEITCLKRKLRIYMGVDDDPTVDDWEIGECLSTWWRPTFEGNLFPYPVPHIEMQKEIKKIYLVRLPERASFAVPSNLKLLAVPMFELFGNDARYGSLLATLPQCISRFDTTIV